MRAPERVGRANGYKPKNVNSSLGNLALQIPQVRGDIDFYPSSLEKGERSGRALKLSMAQMYIEGVTSRKVSSVLEAMCGLNFSSSEVCRASAMLDDELERWRSRPIGRIEYLMLDARYEKVRMDGAVVSCAVLIATGGAGRWETLGTGRKRLNERG